ncbi:hypothetical protein BOX15_Mlig013773g2 [Macrostomum lignano]|uniref:Uncharacterized protein n=1 Tax=Macrostomum lignano TaxID=282301 RepID=A0A267E8T3_9PLAT|nr:hypothetical protein BOX15_Mlig013773g2 [Macrostomum lignano]
MESHRPELKTVAHSAPVKLLLLCNEAMRKRCQCLAGLLQSAACHDRRLLTVQLKCVTFAETDNGDGAFSMSAKTYLQLESTDVVLCMLRVGRVQVAAWRQLVDMLAARQARFRAVKNDRNQHPVMLLQCCGAAYAVDEVSEKTAPDTDPSSVDWRLRSWLAGHANCQPDDLASVSVDNSSAGKALRHRLFGRRYRIQVEFADYACAASSMPRRHSLYRLTSGRAAADGGCSPQAVVKRCLSLDDQLDSSALDESGYCCFNSTNNEDKLAVEHKQQLFHLDFIKPAGAAATLVIAATRSCSVEAELCLNNLNSRGHRALFIDAFAASLQNKGLQPQPPQPQQRRMSTLRLLLSGRRRNDPVVQLADTLAQLTPQSASGVVLLLFCRRHRSRLLAELLRCAAQPESKLTALPQAVFVAIVGPVTEVESQQLRQLGNCNDLLRCQLDVICCPEGLAGQRVLSCLVPGLAAMLRQLEVAAAAAHRPCKFRADRKMP